MSTLLKWPIVKLKDLAEAKKNAMVGGPFGSNLVSADYVTEGVPVVRGVNLPKGDRFSCEKLVFVSESKADSLKTNLALPGDLVFTQRGTLGQVGIIPLNTEYTRFLISQSQMKMTVDLDEADPVYLYNYFRLPSTVSYISNHALQSGVPHINLGILRKLEVVCPPVQVQKKIAAILSTYDDLIENNKRRIALLEKMAEEIYREWFVRFRFPGYQKTEFEKGIPKGWDKKSFGEIVSYYIGGGWGEDSETPTFTDGAYVIRGTDIPALANGDYSNKVYRYHKPSNLKSRKLQQNDFVFEVSGGSKNQLLGRNLMVSEGLLSLFESKVMCASFCKQIRFDSDQVSPYFMKYYLKLYYECDLVGIYQVQSTGISNYQFESFLKNQVLFIPESKLMDKFEQIIQPIIKQQEMLAHSTRSLKLAKDTLLPRLISGKLSVEELDIQFPPSMLDEDAADSR